jgi:hypothetical protein
VSWLGRSAAESRDFLSCFPAPPCFTAAATAMPDDSTEDTLLLIDPDLDFLDWAT